MKIFLLFYYILCDVEFLYQIAPDENWLVGNIYIMDNL